VSSAVPPGARWLFWDVDPDAIDVVRDRDFVIPRVIEHGGMTEVQWLISVVGLEEIHRFLREVGHPELSPRTLSFWRAVFEAQEEEWASPPDWRRNSSTPWID
jgi:hypothetical protein